MPIPLQNLKINHNHKNDIISVSFKMTRDYYHTIRDEQMVSDLALAILAGVEKELREAPVLDNPNLAPVEVKEKYEEDSDQSGRV